MPYTPTKIKCPKCERLIPKRIIKANGGRCNYCGYFIASNLELFLNGGKKKE